MKRAAGIRCEVEPRQAVIATIRPEETSKSHGYDRVLRLIKTLYKKIYFENNQSPARRSDLLGAKLSVSLSYVVQQMLRLIRKRHFLAKNLWKPSEFSQPGAAERIPLFANFRPLVQLKDWMICRPCECILQAST